MEKTVYGSDAYRERIDHYYKILNDKLSKSSRVEARLMGVDMLPRVMVALEQHSDTCPHCQKYVDEWNVAIEHVHQTVAGDNRDLRREFERLGNDVVAHLETTHQMFPKGKRLSFISLWAMLIGMGAGLLLWFAQLFDSWGAALMLGWLVGMAVGNVLGRTVEGRLRKKHQLF